MKTTDNVKTCGCLFLLALAWTSSSVADNENITPPVPIPLAEMGLSPMQSAQPVAPQPVVQQPVRFDIQQFIFEGISLFTEEQINKTVAPFLGRDKDFSDVQHAIEAIEALYAEYDYTVVQVALPEQELTKGSIYFRVLEGKYGKITVTGNKFHSEENVRNALPSIVTGAMPQADKVGGHLKLANTNPSRYISVAFKQGEGNAVSDVDITVADVKTQTWGFTADNTGTKETGRMRTGIYYRHANMFDLDHSLFMQVRTSPTHMDSTASFSASYNIPFYSTGDNLEISVSHSRVNTPIAGFDRYRGGGQVFGLSYNHPFDSKSEWNASMQLAMNWRKFRAQELSSYDYILYNAMHVSPLTVTYQTDRQFEKTSVSASVGLSVNMPGLSFGKRSDFDNYDQINFIVPDANYKIKRFNAYVTHSIGEQAQVRGILVGQHSNDILIQAEQFRLGGQDGVRGFSEGSEGGEKALRVSFEAYSPSWPLGALNTRGIAFADAGYVRNNVYQTSSSIGSIGLGLRMGYSDKLSLNLDAGRIQNAGDDVNQKVGDWRMHMNMSATF